MLTEDSELLQKNDKNFSGKNFRENICYTSKSKKQTLEMLSNASQTKYKPFPRLREGVSEDNNNKNVLPGKERRHSFPKNDTIMATKIAMDTDMVDVNQETLFNKVDLCSYVVRGSKTHTSLHKKLIMRKKNSKCAVSRKVKKLYRKLENSEKRHRNSVVSGKLYYTILQNSLTEKHLNSLKLTQEEKILVQKEIHEMLNKEAILETPNHLEGEFICNLLLVKKKRWGESTSNELETPRAVHTLPSLQDEGFAVSSKHSEEGKLHAQTGFEGCILFSSIKSCIQKICSVSLVRETLRVSLPLFWTRPSTKNFTKYQFHCYVV